MTIPVVIIPDGGDMDSILYSFSNTIFDMIDLPEDVTCVKLDSNLEYEKHLVKTSLQLCKEKYPNKNCILVKDTSTTVFQPDQISIFASHEIKEDILYLCTWTDSCNLYRESVNVEGVEQVTTYKPYGFQSMVFSPKARDYILSPQFPYSTFLGLVLPNEIYNGNLTARTYVNNIFNYDIMKYARDTMDYIKRNKCNDAVITPSNGIPPSTYFYVAGIITLIVVAGVGAFKLGPDTTTREQEDKD
jgi:hypothetical protein